MKVRILESAFILDFFDDSYDSQENCSIIKAQAEVFSNQIKVEELVDWEVYFEFWHNNVKQILIYTRNKSLPVEKYKEIVVHIPMPIKDKVAWGVELEQHIYQNDDHLDGLRNFQHLDVDYSKFDNRKDYILDCMSRAVTHCFQSGFTINNIKIKA